MTTLLRRQPKQPAWFGVLDQPNGSVGSNRDVANAVVDFPAFGRRGPTWVATGRTAPWSAATPTGASDRLGGSPVLSSAAAPSPEAGRTAGRYVTIAAATGVQKGPVAAILQRSVEVAPDVIFIDPSRVTASQLAALFAIAERQLGKPKSTPLDYLL